MFPESQKIGLGEPTGPGTQILVSQTPEEEECGPIPGAHCQVTVWPATMVMMAGTNKLLPPGPTITRFGMAVCVGVGVLLCVTVGVIVFVGVSVIVSVLVIVGVWVFGR